jgi:cobalt-zinc-cadmium resistance protein CzcA
VVGFNVRNSDIQTVVDDLKKSIEKEIKFEPGYYTTYGGAFKNLEDARNRLAVAVPIALLLIFMLLFFTFHSFKQAILIFTAIPLSTIGGIAALWMRDMPFSISAGIGFIALFGVAVLNGIVLIGEFNHLKLNETKNPLEIIIRGSSSRLRPVLMTALVASLGFLPMALSHGSGAEVQKPLATVVIGGLVSATFLTLFILPVLYLLFEKRTYLKSKKLAVIIPLLFLFGISTYAQSTKVLSMQDAVQKALVNNAGVAANETNITYQKAIKRTATELPKADITYMQGQYNSFYKNDNNLTVTQIIPFPTVFIAQNKLGINQIKAGEHQLQHVKNNLAFEVRQAYTHLQYLYMRQALLQKTDSLYQTFARAAKLRYDAGEATLLEKSTAQMHFMEAQNQLKQNQLDIDASMFQIMALLNTSNSITLKENELKPILLELNIDSTQIKNNPMLAYMQQQVTIAQQQKNVELNKTLPDFKLGYFNQTLIGSSNYNDASIATSDNRFQGFLLGVNIPLWYFPNASKIKAANLQSRISQQYYQQYEIGLDNENKTAIAEYKRAKNNLDYYINSALPNAELVLNQAQKSYKQGDISYTEYLNAIRNATLIRQDYWLAVKNHNNSIFKLQFLAGINDK